MSTHQPRQRVAALSLAALGIVYGDIGTSPLYALRESFHAEHDLAVSVPNVLGILSCVFWALLLVISIKYLVFILRADNRGEGGILALTALLAPMKDASSSRHWIIALGLFGAALLYGDGMITPAISVLSAVEGLEVATPFFAPYIVPITTAILVALFAIQSHGTESVGKAFGPVTLVWFATLAALGVYQIVQQPAVLAAVNPLYAVRFFLANGVAGFLVLGSVFLVVTGGEALYADMGHFGRKPIRLAWFSVVLPALLINYFGQGALLMRDARAVENPFYHMGPGWATYPLVALATIATVIASQAVISGSYSLAMQSVQLGYSPRLAIEHTSEHERGQIYVPFVNWALMIACIALVWGFGSSSALAAAYGVAVTTTMVITTILFYVLARRHWQWPLPIALGVTAFFLLIDGSFWLATMVKVPHGGWFPLAVAVVIFSLLVTWKTGRRVLARRMSERALPIADFMDMVNSGGLRRVSGTAVFMFGDPDRTPPAMLHNLKHNGVLHDRVLLLAVETKEQPHVELDERVDVTELGGGVWSVRICYGFMDEVDVPATMRLVGERIGFEPHPMDTTYFLGREKLIGQGRTEEMDVWRQQLFVFMSQNSRSPTDFFRLPPNRVVELGAHVEL